MAGTVVSIHISDRKRVLPRRVEQVEAVASRGLVGDRNFNRTGTFSAKWGPDRELTLIAMEALEALDTEKGIRLKPEESRRNLATRGIDLNALVGREFSIGEVLCRGLLPCDPCGHLERLTYLGVHQGLKERGGLRATIVRGGVIRVGDEVRDLGPAPPYVPPGEGESAGA